MRFSIEQVFLTDDSGKPLDAPSAAAYHYIEAETVDAALSWFLNNQQANVVGTVRRFPGAQAIATAQQDAAVFTFHVEPGTDAFRRKPRGAASQPSESERESDRPR